MTARYTIPEGSCIAELRSPLAGRVGIEPFPFDELDAGDWFTVHVALRFPYARSRAESYGRNNGLAFSCRVDDSGALRVIRVL